MFIQQIYTGCLAQASYYIECNGEAAVIDPIREPQPYLDVAATRSARIKYVFETHFHADFVSGHLDLSDKTKAAIVFGPNARPAYPAFIAKHNEKFLLGNCTIEVLHTPGHTIESCCYLLRDIHDTPQAIFTGDTLFVGDVGRPDLMSGNKSKTELGAMLYDSLNESIKPLPDSVTVYPGHGAGSACGKNLGVERYSTIGEQKRSNYALQPMSRSEFIAKVTDDLPTPPAYFFKDASINIMGYKHLEDVLSQQMVALSVDEALAARIEGAQLLDTRKASLFAKGFIPSSIQIGLQGDFAPWAGCLLDIEKPIVVICESGSEKEVITRLARIGYENVLGYLEGGFEAWQDAGHEIDHIACIEAEEYARYIDEEKHTAIDVRKKTETQIEHLENTLQIPLSEFPKQAEHLDRNKQYLLFCKGGYRSMIAASLLKRQGILQIINVNGGIEKIMACRPALLTP